MTPLDESYNSDDSTTSTQSETWALIELMFEHRPLKYCMRVANGQVTTGTAIATASRTNTTCDNELDCDIDDMGESTSGR